LLTDRKSVNSWDMRQAGILVRFRSASAAALRWLADHVETVESVSDALRHGISIHVIVPASDRAKAIEFEQVCSVSCDVTRKQAECDLYVEFFLDWCFENGHTGEYDSDQVLALTRKFDTVARTPPALSTPFFRALKRAGVIHREGVDLPSSDPRFAVKKAQGCQRPRLRIYNLPIDPTDGFVPTVNAEPLPLAA
jgi:hypothetical protein